MKSIASAHLGAILVPNTARIYVTLYPALCPLHRRFVSHSGADHSVGNNIHVIDLACTTSTTPTTDQGGNDNDNDNNNNSSSPNRKRHPHGFWKDRANHRRFFDQMATELKLHHLDDWYYVRKAQVLQRGAKALLDEYYGGSLSHALRSIYPEHPWEPSRFTKGVPQGFWKSLENQRQFLDRIGNELGLNHLDDWYAVPMAEVSSRGGASLLKIYNGSLVRTLVSVYPEHSWDPTLFSQRVPRGHWWHDPANQRSFFQSLAKELNVERWPQDWSNVTPEQVRAKKGGTAILRKYQGSLSQALQAVFPEHSWTCIVELSSSSGQVRGRGSRHRHYKNSVPHGHWKDPANHRRFFDRIAPELGVVTQPDDWYKITVDDVVSKGGGSLLANYYGNSLFRALQAVYPEHSWNAKERVAAAAGGGAKAPNGFYDSMDNQRQLFDRIGRDLNVEKWEDWYSITSEQVHAKGGGGLLSGRYGNSLSRAVASIYPEHPWVPWRFSRIASSKKLWADMAIQRQFFDSVASELGIKHLDDWYSVTLDEVTRHRGGGTLLREYYGNSLARALQAVYPEHAWQPWRFPRISNSIDAITMCNSSSSSASSASAVPAVLQDFISCLSKELGIAQLDDWYRVSQAQIQRFGGTSLVRRNGGLHLVLKRLYPHHDWDERKFATNYKKSVQRWLVVTVQSLFPGAEVLEDYLHPDMLFTSSKQPMELDVYIPSLSLAFEYQGEQHYEDIHVLGDPSSSSSFSPGSSSASSSEAATACSLAQQQQYNDNDSEKRLACEHAGITLIVVPYWWDNTAASLAATIREARPDLLIHMQAAITATAAPIPLEKPQK